jgi:hypothetical protein
MNTAEFCPEAAIDRLSLHIDIIRAPSYLSIGFASR